MSPAQSKIAKVVLVIAIALGAYGFGRYAQPAKVVVTEKIVATSSTTVDTSQIIDTIKALNKRIDELQTVMQQKNTHSVRVTEKDPNGTVKTTVTTDTSQKTDTTNKTSTQVTSTAATQVKTDTTAKQVTTLDKETTKTTTFDSRPSWSVTLQPGFEFGDALGNNTSSYNLLSKALPMAPHMMANIGIERRLLGPLFVGAWANTRLDAGLSIRAEW